jgi:hypothetical protein
MLHARGIDCEIFEQADSVRELGVGINTLPHAIKELAQLGLLSKLDQVGIRTHELFYMNRIGQEIWREPRGTRCRFRISAILDPSRPFAGGHLPEHVRARLGESASTADTGSARSRRTKAASHVISSAATARTAQPRAATFWSAPTAFIRSSRETLYPNEGPARWNGSMLWRGATDWPKFLTGRSMVIAGGMAGKLVVYPIGEGARDDKPSPTGPSW